MQKDFLDLNFNPAFIDKILIRNEIVVVILKAQLERHKPIVNFMTGTWRMYFVIFDSCGTLIPVYYTVHEKF